MKQVTDRPEPVNKPPESECWELAQRIGSSRCLLKAPQLRELLLYIVRRSLEELPSAISEREIACKALGRSPDFNPGDDNIVRVQMRHLRHKLEEYFATEGAGERLVLTIPKGVYVARFEPRPETTAAPPLESVAPPGDNGVSRARPVRAGWWFGLIAAVLSIGFAGVFLTKRPAASKAPSANAEMARQHTDPLWSRIFVPGQKTAIVLSDSCLVAVQDILDVDIPLNQYLAAGSPDGLIKSVADPKLQSALQLLAGRQYTSLGDAALASKLMEVSRRYAVGSEIRYSRFLSVREFKAGNFVLVGSHRGVVWEQLFEPGLNFVLEKDRDHGDYIFRNKAPQPGEQPVYQRFGSADTNTYADIALLPNLTRTGYVLILSGIDMAATEAAGDLVVSPEFSDDLIRMLGSPDRPDRPPYIEMLMQAKLVAGITQAPKIVAYRLVPSAIAPALPASPDVR